MARPGEAAARWAQASGRPGEVGSAREWPGEVELGAAREGTLRWAKARHWRGVGVACKGEAGSAKARPAEARHGTHGRRYGCG